MLSQMTYDTNPISAIRYEQAGHSVIKQVNLHVTVEHRKQQEAASYL